MTTSDIPLRLGEYAVIREIGHGPTGFVCLVRAPDGSELAAKILHPRFAEDEHKIRRFEREAVVARSLSHPHLIRVHRVVAHSEFPTPFYLMDYLSGGHFGQYRGNATSAALEQLAQVCDALQYLHSKKLTHFDVKPSNMLVSATGTACLSDFGTVSATGGPPPGGTLGYMAPEHFAAESPDARADIYSAGVVLYELLTGELPYTASNPFALQYQISQSSGPPRPTSAINVSGQLWTVIERAMASSPADRFSSAAEMSEAIRAVAPLCANDKLQ